MSDWNTKPRKPMMPMWPLLMKCQCRQTLLLKCDTLSLESEAARLSSTMHFHAWRLYERIQKWETPRRSEERKRHISVGQGQQFYPTHKFWLPLPWFIYFVDSSQFLDYSLCSSRFLLLILLTRSCNTLSPALRIPRPRWILQDVKCSPI